MWFQHFLLCSQNDLVLNAIMKKIRSQWVVSYHKHDSLLEHIDQEELTEEERKVAWEQYNQQMNMENARQVITAAPVIMVGESVQL